jgi:hypothetical protein
MCYHQCVLSNSADQDDGFDGNGNTRSDPNARSQTISSNCNSLIRGNDSAKSRPGRIKCGKLVRNNQRRSSARTVTHLPSHMRGILLLAAGVAIVSFQKIGCTNSSSRTLRESCCQNRDCDAHLKMTSDARSLSVLQILFVDAFGVHPSAIPTTKPHNMVSSQCNKRWGHSPRYSAPVKSSVLQNINAVWGRRKQNHTPKKSSSIIVCQSTVDEEIAEAMSIADKLDTTSGTTTTNGINGVNGSSVTGSLNGAHNGQYTPVTLNVLPNNNGLMNRESHQHLKQSTGETKALVTVDNPATVNDNNPDVPHPTAAGGYSHTTASRAKISAANKGKTPWNKGKARSEEVKPRIAEGVRRKNRERFLAKLAEEGITEEEYEQQKKENRRKTDAERRARKTANGGYKPTEETKKKISAILKEKYASGEIVRKSRDPTKVRRGFSHSEETKAKIAETLRRKWAEDQEYREYMTNKTVANGDVRNAPSVRKRISETLKKRWEDPEFRQTMMKKFANRKAQSKTKAKEHRKKISEAMKRKWMDEEYRKRATEGMVKGKEKAPPKRVTPKQPKGITKMDPLTSQADAVAVKQLIKKKNSKTKSKSTTVAKKKTVKLDDGENIDLSSVVALEPLSVEQAAAAREVTKEPELEEDLPEGSIQRLRKERRDLYDLLYGDEEEMAGEYHDNTPMEDVSFTSMLLNGSSPTGSSSSSGRRIAQKKNDSKRPVYANGNVGINGGGSHLASLLADDEDLDDFDPYGLER